MARLGIKNARQLFNDALVIVEKNTIAVCSHQDQDKIRENITDLALRDIWEGLPKKAVAMNDALPIMREEILNALCVYKGASSVDWVNSKSNKKDALRRMQVYVKALKNIEKEDSELLEEGCEILGIERKRDFVLAVAQRINLADDLDTLLMAITTAHDKVQKQDGPRRKNEAMRLFVGRMNLLYLQLTGKNKMTMTFNVYESSLEGRFYIFCLAVIKLSRIEENHAEEDKKLLGVIRSFYEKELIL
jgi:hypothetical protein